MAKITRKLMRIFGENAGLNQIGVFGSLAAGAIDYTTDVEEVQSLAEWLDGWFGAILGANSPAIEDMNGMCYVFGYQLSYLMQEGIAEWNAETTYYIGCLVNDGNGNVYRSITDTNLNHAVTDTAYWLQLLKNNGSDLSNVDIAASVATNALTISLKTALNADPSSLNPQIISFRSSTLTSGLFVSRTISAATSLTIPSGTTIGTADGIEAYLYVYAIDNAGTVVLGVSMNFLDEGKLYSSSAISGGASAQTLYSTAAVTTKAVRLIGRIIITEATAGTWSTAPTSVATIPFLTDSRWGCNYETNATTTLNNNTVTDINYTATKIYDPYSMFNGATGTFKRAGIYTISASLALNGTIGDGQSVTIYLLKNGSIVRHLSLFNVVDAQTAGNITLNGTTQYSFAAGDTMKIQAIQNSGASMAMTGEPLNNWLTVQRVGEI